jgi:hypothetical protein
MFTTP